MTRNITRVVALALMLAISSCEADLGGQNEPDRRPVFGTQTVANQTYTVGTTITPLVLPAATGGDGHLTYTLVPTVPGLEFNARTRTLRGTPTAAGTRSMTYRVEDGDGDAATVGFVIAVMVAPGPMVYWTGHPTIGRANLAGLGAEIIVEKTDGFGPIALDLKRDKIYWIYPSPIGGHRADYFIRRANLDGSDIEDVLFFDKNSLNRPQDIALDVANSKVYWTLDVGIPNQQDQIQRANLDGTAVESLTTRDDNAYDPLEIAGDKMYFLGDWGSQIWQANLDGSSLEVLIDLSDHHHLFLQEIAVDYTAERIYFTSHDEIYRVNLDGSGIEKILDLTSGWNHSIDLDVSNGKIYWAHGRSKIQRANLDGSQIEDVVTRDTTSVRPFIPYFIALDPRDR